MSDYLKKFSANDLALIFPSVDKSDIFDILKDITKTICKLENIPEFKEQCKKHFPTLADNNISLAIFIVKKNHEAVINKHKTIIEICNKISYDLMEHVEDGK